MKKNLLAVLTALVLALSASPALAFKGAPPPGHAAPGSGAGKPGFDAGQDEQVGAQGQGGQDAGQGQQGGQGHTGQGYSGPTGTTGQGQTGQGQGSAGVQAERGAGMGGGGGGGGGWGDSPQGQGGQAGQGGGSPTGDQGGTYRISGSRDGSAPAKAGSGAAGQAGSAASATTGGQAAWKNVVAGGRLGPFTFGYMANTKDFSGRHPGVDILAACGSNVHPAADGEVVAVIKKGDSLYSSMGNAVMVKHKVNGKDVYSIYLHMQAQPSVKVGDHVTAKSVLGKVGTTGHSSSCHVHFELRRFPQWLCEDQRWWKGNRKNAPNIYGTYYGTNSKGKQDQDAALRDNWLDPTKPF